MHFYFQSNNFIIEVFDRQQTKARKLKLKQYQQNIHNLNIRLLYKSLYMIFQPKIEKQCLASPGILYTLCGPPTTYTWLQLYKLTPKQQNICFKLLQVFTAKPFLQKVTLLPSLIYSGFGILFGGLMFRQMPITSPTPYLQAESILSPLLTTEPSADLYDILSRKPRGYEVLKVGEQRPTLTAELLVAFLSFLASYLMRNSIQTCPQITGRLKIAVEWPQSPTMRLPLVIVIQGGLSMSLSREQGVVSSDMLHMIFYFFDRKPPITAEESSSTLLLMIWFQLLGCQPFLCPLVSFFIIFLPLIVSFFEPLVVFQAGLAAPAYKDTDFSAQSSSYFLSLSSFLYSILLINQKHSIFLDQLNKQQIFLLTIPTQMPLNLFYLQNLFYIQRSFPLCILYNIIVKEVKENRFTPSKIL